MSLAALLDREFEALHGGKRPPRTPLPKKGVATQVGQAEYLRISPEHYNKIRKGKATLTPARARQWQLTLRGEGDDLLRALLDAARSPGDTSHRGDLVAQVRGYFGQVQDGNTLLAVLYQGLPRADHTNRYQETARFAGEAIARGLRFAQIQPFGNRLNSSLVPNNPEESFQDDRNSFFSMLRNRVRSVHKIIRDEATKAMGRMGLKPEEDRGRIVLYERNAVYPATAAVQDRLFYRRWKSSRETEMHEWVSAVGDDIFCARPDEGGHERQLFEAMYAPIIGHWAQQGDLPAEDAALGSPHWSVYSG